jgi:hypothetical protein
MKKAILQDLPVEALIERYVAVGVAQYEAELDDNTRKFNRLYDDVKAVEAELKSRPGDQRTALLTLYKHANMQVRLNAAHATLTVAPEAARGLLVAIRDSRWMPQALHAGMSLWNLEKGVFRPT